MLLVCDVIVDRLANDVVSNETGCFMERVRQTIDAKSGELLHVEKIPGNENFVMLFKDKLPVIRSLIKADAMAASLLFFLVEQMARDNLLVASQRTLAELVGISAASICRGLNTLKKHGIIEIKYVGNTPAIAINADLVWSTHANGKKYAACRAKMLISEDEQKKPRGKRLKIITTAAKAEDPRQQQLFQADVKANTEKI